MHNYSNRIYAFLNALNLFTASFLHDCIKVIQRTNMKIQAKEIVLLDISKIGEPAKKTKYNKKLNIINVPFKPKTITRKKIT